MEHFDPGIHDIPAERYFASQGCSASMLDILAQSTPAHLAAYLKSNNKPDTDAMRFGVLCHYAILQGDAYKKSFHVRPEGMKLTTKEGKAWKEDHNDKPDITFEEALRISGMVESVRHHKFASRLLHNGKPEQSIFCFDQAGTLRKSRLDSLTAGTALADIKTCQSASLENFERTISKYRYHVRAAYYLDNCHLVNLDKSHFFFICVEKEPPYAVRCLQLAQDVVEFGRKVYQADLQIYRNCLEKDEWPGWGDGFDEIALPAWQMKALYAVL